MSTNKNELYEKLQEAQKFYDEFSLDHITKNITPPQAIHPSSLSFYTQNGHTPPSEEDQIIKNLQEIIQICDARDHYNKQLWHFSENASSIEIQAYLKRNYLILELEQEEEKDSRQGLKKYAFQNRKIYQTIKNHLEDFEIDKAYLYLKIEFNSKNDFLYTVNNKRTKQEEQEKNFIRDLIKKLDQHITGPLSFCIQKKYIDFPKTKGALKIDMKKICSQEIDRPVDEVKELYNSAITFSEKEKKEKYSLDPNEILIFRKIDLEKYNALQETAIQKIKVPAPLTSPDINEAGTEVFVEICIKCKEVFQTIKDIMQPIHERLRRMRKRMAYTQENQKITLKINVIIDKLEQIKQELIDYYVIYSKVVEGKNKEPIVLKILQNSGYGNHIKRIDGSAEKLKLCESIKQQLWDIRITLSTRNEEANKILENIAHNISQLTEFYCEFENNFELFSNVSNKMKTIIKTQTEIEKMDTSPKNNNNNFINEIKELNEKEKVSHNKDETQKSIKQNLSLDEWRKQAEENKKQEKSIKDQERRAIIMKNIKEKNILKSGNILSPQEREKREARIKNFGLTKNIKELFEELYCYRFGHDDLEKLVNALEKKGENIKLQTPNSGSAHYSIIIDNTLGYYEKETEDKDTAMVREKGGAFTPHANAKFQKNSKYFLKFRIENIQSTFWRAGYTIKALGLDVKTPEHLQAKIEEKSPAQISFGSI